MQKQQQPQQQTRQTPQGTTLRVFREQDHRGCHVVEKLTTDAGGKTFIAQYTLAPEQIRQLLSQLGPNVRVEHVPPTAATTGGGGPTTAQPWHAQFNIQGGGAAAEATGVKYVHPEMISGVPTQRSAYQSTHELKYGQAPSRAAAPHGSSGAGGTSIDGYDACGGAYGTYRATSGGGGARVAANVVADAAC